MQQYSCFFKNIIAVGNLKYIAELIKKSYKELTFYRGCHP